MKIGNRDLVPGFEVPGSRLTVVGFDHKDEKSHKYYQFRCDCGNLTIVRGLDVISGSIKSCGCFRKARQGLSRTPEGIAIYHAIKRCHNPDDPQFYHYGGRNIKVCDRYKGKDGIQNLIDDIGRRPTSEHSLDRKNNDGDYEPGNIHWATWEEQANNRRGNHLITYKNETLTIAQWSKKLNIEHWVIRSRLSKGWSEHKALTTPVKLYRKRK